MSSSIESATSLAVMNDDQTVNMFSERGFQLAQRIGRAFATSDAVPAQFRAQTFKKGRDGGEWVDNPAALGNCLVAIETARAVSMSITAVMQNANVIEGRLSWSGKFVIAAINASGRFTPLRFQTRNLGLIKAKYREKLGWNKEKNGYDFRDVEVEVENLECIAWALPAGLRVPLTIGTLAQARDANLPVIESAPVSMRMAVEEGWYGKPGSKWQTEMKHLMLQYRAGSFFGNIHAPDIVMGMGRTSEEVADTTVIDLDTGEITTESLSGKPVVRMPTARAPEPSDVVIDQPAVTETSTEPSTEGASEPAAEAQGAEGTQAQASKTNAAEPARKPAAASQSHGATLATAGERMMVKNRCKNNGIELAAMLAKHGVASLETMTTDQFIAIKDDLPKAS
jgi:hypothetical protein